MPVSPQDFELYSRMTGAPMPTDAMSRMQMAPDVYNFTKSFARKPNLFEKTGNLVKNIGRGAVMALGAPLVAASEAENVRMQEQLRNQGDIAESESVTMENPTEEVIPKAKSPAVQKIEAEMELEKLKQANKLELIAAKKQVPSDTGRMAGGGVVQTDLNPVQMDSYQSLLNPTTADKYDQRYEANQTSSNMVDRKVSQGSQIADDTPNVAEVLSESQDSNPVEFVDPVEVQQQMESEMLGKAIGKRALSKFIGTKGLDKALIGALTQRKIQEEMFGEALSADSNLLDHPDLPGGEDDISLPSGTNTSPTTNLQEQTGGGESLNERYMEHADEMRRMEAKERKGRTKIDRRVGKNLLEERAIANEEAIDSGFMNLDDEGRKKESIRLGSTGGIPNKTDMAEIRKDPEFIAAQESMKPKSTAERTDDFMAQFVEGAKSDIVRGARGNKSLGITRIPATNGDAQVGFVLANKPLDQSPTTATTYGFGVAPGAESLLDNQLNKDSFSDYMKRGMSEAKQGKKRKAGEIFEYLPQSARVVGGTASLGDIVM